MSIPIDSNHIGRHGTARPGRVGHGEARRGLAGLAWRGKTGHVRVGHGAAGMARFVPARCGESRLGPAWQAWHRMASQGTARFVRARQGAAGEAGRVGASSGPAGRGTAGKAGRGVERRVGFRRCAAGRGLAGVARLGASCSGVARVARRVEAGGARHGLARQVKVWPGMAGK
jgi:hypothetical protein